MASPTHTTTAAGTTAGSPAAAAHAHDAHDVKKDIRKYLVVGTALLFGTALTVFMYYVHIPSVATTIAVAVFIATVKGALVAGFFMHLISERKAIYAVMLATVFFFASMMYLIVWHRVDIPKTSNWWEGNVTKKEGPRHAIR